MAQDNDQEDRLNLLRPSVDPEPPLLRKRPSAGSCSRCGAQHSVRLRKRPGRCIPYRTVPALPLPEDVALPTCSRCKAEFPDKAVRTAMAPLLARLYAAELRRRIQKTIAALGPAISQCRLESLLGLSAGYLSRLKAGAGTPSPALVLQLQQLALDPIPRLIEMERIWGEPIPTKSHARRSKSGALRSNSRRNPRSFA